MTKSVYINNVSAVLPNAPVGNDEMEAILGQAGSRPSRARRIILRNNGIKQRYYAIDPETGKQNYTNAALSAEAAQAVIDGFVDSQHVDALAFATSMADQVMPGHGVMVHGELGWPALEVMTASGICVSGVAALKYAYLGVLSGEFSTAVAGASEVASAVMRGDQFEAEIAARVEALESKPEVAFEKDFLRWMLSDGSGAMLLQDKPNAQGLSLKMQWLDLRSFAGEDEVCMYAGGDKESGDLKGWLSYTQQERASQSVMAVKQDVKLLNEKIVYYTVERALADILLKRQLKADDVDWFLPHYSSHFFRNKLHEGLSHIGFEIPYEKWFTNLYTKGNTGSASIFIMLEELWHSGRLESGQNILCYIPESGRFSSAFMLLTVC